ncbi:hypothetical protein C0Q70_09906 [Pomacea canaliculata]|uniref:Uncharacterized protein n=1 Tax=Pomacea canaliculata TaxID=400727 RepID=A0A2T7PB36_POMCA|nr:hypothetical protein C0Q70_09906 [Pomacea canaliculata]
MVAAGAGARGGEGVGGGTHATRQSLLMVSASKCAECKRTMQSTPEDDYGCMRQSQIFVLSPFNDTITPSFVSPQSGGAGAGGWFSSAPLTNHTIHPDNFSGGTVVAVSPSDIEAVFVRRISLLQPKVWLSSALFPERQRAN